LPLLPSFLYWRPPPPPTLLLRTPLYPGKGPLHGTTSRASWTKVFLRSGTPPSLTTLSWLVTGRAWLPSIGPSLVGLEGHRDEQLRTYFEDKIEPHLFNSTSLPRTPPLKQGKSKTTLSPSTLSACPSYTQQFLFVNVSNHASQCQISARKHQQDSHALVSVRCFCF
jgi:hypothetical protein